MYSHGVVGIGDYKGIKVDGCTTQGLFFIDFFCHHGLTDWCVPLWMVVDIVPLICEWLEVP